MLLSPVVVVVAAMLGVSALVAILGDSMSNQLDVLPRSGPVTSPGALPQASTTRLSYQSVGQGNCADSTGAAPPSLTCNHITTLAECIKPKNATSVARHTPDSCPAGTPPLLLKMEGNATHFTTTDLSARKL